MRIVLILSFVLSQKIILAFSCKTCYTKIGCNSYGKCRLDEAYFKEIIDVRKKLAPLIIQIYGIVSQEEVIEKIKNLIVPLMNSISELRLIVFNASCFDIIYKGSARYGRFGKGNSADKAENGLKFVFNSSPLIHLVKAGLAWMIERLEGDKYITPLSIKRLWKSVRQRVLATQS